MSIYGNYLLETKKTNNNIFPVMEFDIMDTLHSVVFDEYCSFSNLLESCTDSDEKKLLEEKCELLLEISFKDIKKKFLDAIKFIWQKLQELIKKIKDFFTGEKRKQAEKDIAELKKQLKEKDIEIDNLQKANSDYEQKMKDVEENNEKYARRLVSIAHKFQDNKYVYFDLYDYLDDDKRKNIQYYFGNLYDFIKNWEYFDDEEDSENQDKINKRIPTRINNFSNKLKEKYPDTEVFLLTDSCIERLKKYTSNSDEKPIDDLITSNKMGGSAYELNNMINDDLNEKVKKGYVEVLTKNADFNSFVDYLEKEIKEDKIRGISDINVDLSRHIQSLEKIISKIDFSNNRKENKEIYSSETYKTITKCINIMKVNVNIVTNLANFEGKKFAACTTAVKLCREILG